MNKPPPVAVTAMIINGALLAGLFTFGVIAMLIVDSEAPVDSEGPPLMTLMALGFVVAAVVGSFIVETRSKRRTIEGLVSGSLIPPEQAKVTTLENALGGRYMLAMILGTALLDGAGFMAVGAYILEKHWLAIVLFAVVLAVMAARFSTPGRLTGWIARVQRDADDQRGLTA